MKYIDFRNVIHEHLVPASADILFKQGNLDNCLTEFIFVINQFDAQNFVLQ
jgi:hypothetical protein